MRPILLVVFLASPVLAQAQMMESSVLGAARSFMLASPAMREALSEQGDQALKNAIYLLTSKAQALEPKLIANQTAVVNMEALLDYYVKAEGGPEELRRDLVFTRANVFAILELLHPLTLSLQDAVDAAAPRSNAALAAQSFKDEALRLRAQGEALAVSAKNLSRKVDLLYERLGDNNVLYAEKVAANSGEIVQQLEDLLKKSEALVKKARQDQNFPDIR